MCKEKILEILENAKDGNGTVPMRLVRQAFDKLPEPCEDTISRREAIKAVNNAFDRETILTGFVRSIAVKAIRDMPSAQPEQKIYRSMSVEEFEAWLYNHGICHPDIHESIACDIVPSLIDDAINELPPAPPDYVTGFWLIRKWGDDAKCSNCGHTFKDVYDMDNHDRFCRFFGRKMEGVKEVNI